MPTVPNWIADAVIYETHNYGREASVRDTLSWRATKTQVVVTVQTSRGHAERRFRLADLKEVAARDAWSSSQATLMDPADPRVAAARKEMTIRRTVSTLRSALAERLDSSATDVEELVLAVGRIQRAATKALAELADLL